MKKVLFSLLACAMLFVASCASEGMKKLEEVQAAAQAKDFAAMEKGVNELVAMKSKLAADELVGTAFLVNAVNFLPENANNVEKVLSNMEVMIDLIKSAGAKDASKANQALEASLKSIAGGDQMAGMDCEKYAEFLQTQLDNAKANLEAQAAAQGEGEGEGEGEDEGEDEE